jgi:hypothetical protein
MEEARSRKLWTLVAVLAVTLVAAAVWAGISLAGGSSSKAPASGKQRAVPSAVEKAKSAPRKQGHDGRECPFGSEPQIADAVDL